MQASLSEHVGFERLTEVFLSRRSSKFADCTHFRRSVTASAVRHFASGTGTCVFSAADLITAWQALERQKLPLLGSRFVP